MRRIHRYLIITGLLLLTILGIIESDAFIKRENINWDGDNPVDWSNFRGYPDFLSKYYAAIHSTFKYEVLNDNYDSIRVQTYTASHHSWVKYLHEKSEYSLRHEQYHFNLSEAIARKFRKELVRTSRKYLNEEVIQRVYNKYLSERNSIQGQYDEQTDHSLILEKQKDWEYIIDSLLNSLSYYSSPVVIFNNEEEKNQTYYRQVDLDAKNHIVGKNPIDSMLAIHTRCYKFHYLNNRVSKVEYLDRTLPAIDRRFNVSSIVFKYPDSCEYRYYYDVAGNRTKNSNGSFTTFIKRQGEKLIVANLDQNGQKDENKFGVYILEWKLDDKGRKSSGIFYNKERKRITNAEGYYSIVYLYDDYDNVIEIRSINDDGELLNLKNGIASYNYTYDEKGNMIKYQTLNNSLDLVPHDGDISTSNFQYDIYGNIICESYYKPNGLPHIDTDGTVISYYTYDKYSNLKEAKHYGLNRNLIISDEKKGRVERDFDKYGRVVEIRNFDAYDNYLNDIYGRCKIEISYLRKHFIYEQKLFKADSLKVPQYYKTIRLSYDEDDNIEMEAYYDNDNNLLPDDNGACFIKYKYDTRGSTIQRSFYNENDELLPVVNGVAIFRYKYDNRNNKIETAYFDQNENLKETVNNIAIDRYFYDDKNRLIERRYYNSKMELTKNRDSVKIIRWKHDRKGNIIRESYVDSEGVLTPNSVGIAFVEYDFDNKNNKTEIRYFNKNYKLVEDVKGGVAIIKYEYSDENSIIKEAYFDRNIQLINSAEGFAIRLNSYDKYNRMIQQKFLSANELPVIAKAGYASIEKKYDSNSNIVVEIYRDEKGKLIENKDGYAIGNWVHNRNGDVVESFGFGADEKNLLSVNMGPFADKINKLTRFKPHYGKNTRIQTTYYDNGQKETEVKYINEKLEGQYTSWYKTGEVESEISYREGKRNGATIEYYRNGNKRIQMEYKDNAIVHSSEVKWYENGHIKSLYAEGELIEYSIDGEIVSN